MSITLQQAGILVLCGVSGWLLFRQSEQIREAIEKFRGGPRPPSHPLPSDDGFMLLRKRKQKAHSD